VREKDLAELALAGLSSYLRENGRTKVCRCEPSVAT
jgi:hypothetical protein